MQKQYFYGHFNDHLWPHVGCGYRLVEAQIGHKWVKVRAAVPWNTNCKRIRLSVWQSLQTKPTPKPEYLKKKRPKP